MSITPPNVLQQARLGNPDAIAALINRHLEAQGITAHVMQQENTLRVNLESAQVPNQADLVTYVKKGITGLELATIHHLTVSAKQPGSDTFAWSEALELRPSAVEPPSDLNLDFDSATPAVEDLGDLDLGSALDISLDGTDLDGTDLDGTGLDFDLGLIDGTDDAGLEADSTFDLSFTDGTDDGFDLGLTDEPPAADLLDFDLDLTTDSASDLGVDAPGDFDLSFADSAGDLTNDLDLGLPDETAAAMPASDLDFDLGLNDVPSETSAATDLDFDLGFADQTLDSASADGLDFDLGLIDEPGAATDAEDLDLDLNFADSPTGLTPGDELDFDLGFTDQTAAPAADFDASFADGPGLTSADGGFDFDLGLEEGAADLDAEIDFDNMTAATALPLDLGSDNLALSPELDAPELDSSDLDLDFGDTSEFDLEALETSDGGAGADVDLPSEAPLPPDITGSELDDLWGSDAASAGSPDLGLAASQLATDSGAAPWEAEADFPDLDDMVAWDDGLASDPEVAADDFNPEAPEALDLDLGTAGTDGIEAFDAEMLGSEALGAEAMPPDDAGPTDLDVADDLDWAAADLSTPDVGSEDLADPDFAALDLGTEDLGTDDLLAPEELASDADLDLAWTPEQDLREFNVADLGVSSASAPPWAEAAESFDPELELESTADPGSDLGDAGDFDAGFVFDPAVDSSPPNPFEVEEFSPMEDSAGALGLEAEDIEPVFFAAEADVLFDSTVELDQTVEGDFMAAAGLGEAADFAAFEEDEQTFGQPETFTDEPVPAELSFEVDDADLAFESVELGAEDIGGPGFGAEGFADEGLVDVGFDNESFDSESFDNESFDADLFSDSAGDSNGFIQDRNGVALGDDEPDATDDFIQEFGTDPSSHVSLTPDQFDADGGVRQTGGSGLPMRLILGLGLVALLLLLGGLLLNGLRRGRTNPVEPVVTEPVVPDAGTPAPPAEPPPNPAAVAEEDLFRQAVNAAQSAANQAQTAQTAAQWQSVADAWAAAIALMERVPQADPNYAVAQQKAVQYQPNLAYAQQNVQRLQ